MRDPDTFRRGAFGDSDYFTYIAAFGAFNEVSYKTPQETKQAWGHLAYLLEGMSSLSKIEHYFTRVEHDNGVTEGDFIFAESRIQRRSPVL